MGGKMDQVITPIGDDPHDQALAEALEIRS